MKKIYALIASAAVIFSATAAPQISAEKIKDLKSTELSVKKEMSKFRTSAKATSGVQIKEELQNKRVVTGMYKADGQPTIEGLWIFDMGDYYFEDSANRTLYIEYEATLDGTTVTFEDPIGYELPFIGTLNPTTNKISFSKQYLLSSSPYYIFQNPFEYDYSLQDLVMLTSLVGDYYPEQGVINFPADHGLAWEAYTNRNGTGNSAGYFGIYDLEGATQEATGETEPLDEIQEGQWKTLGNATFIDSWILAAYSMGGVPIDPNNYPYEVELQQNIANSDLYRLWKPYKTAGALVFDQGLNQSKFDGQIQFDISDPDHVVVIANDMPAGFKNNNGEFYLSNELGWYINYMGDEPGMKEFVISVLYAEGEDAVPDTFENGTVTINTPMFDYSAAHAAGYSWTSVTYPTYIIFPEMEPESGDIEGNMTTQLDMTQGYDDPELLEPTEYEVTASYDPATQKLTLYNFVELNPVTFTVGVAAGSLTAAGNQISSIDSFTDDGENYTFTYYYADLDTQEYGLNGTIYNINENQCELTINPWGEAMDYEGEPYFNNAYFNTVVTLDFTIEGLPEKPNVTINSVQGVSVENKLNLVISYTANNLPTGAKVYAEITCDYNDDEFTGEKDGDAPIITELTSNPATVATNSALGIPHSFNVVVIVRDAEGKEIASDVYNTGSMTVSGIGTIESDTVGARYYNLQGVEVEKPANGVYIKVEGNKAAKVIL